MRILRVNTRLNIHGGAELSTLVEVEELAARGHEVTVVTVVQETTPAAKERLDRAGIAHRHLDGNVGVQAWALRRLIASWRPDLVQAVIFRSELVGALATIGRRTPLLVSLVNMQYDRSATQQASSTWRLEVMRRLESILLRCSATAFHCLTDAGRQHSIDRLHLDPSRITVIPRGRRTGDLRVTDADIAAVRDEFGVDGAPLVVNVGRHELQKGQDLLIAAIVDLGRRGPMPRVVLAGREGNLTTELQRRIDAAGLTDQVTLLGARDDVAVLLAAADLVCVTSRWEGLGGSIIEALGAGAPIVAFGVPAVREVVGDAGVLVEPFDTTAYTDAMAALLADAPERERLSTRATARFEERFDLERVVDEIERLYRHIVA